MVRNLRSFIQEKFPFELRVELDLISRRRDIDSKPEEILKLLKQYGVGDVGKLGPGTNRYAFRLDGFVVKIATDHDGKIDNKKEFKMAKRLYPLTPKTYEVSANGSILVAEYVQPFSSYNEMLKYADQIRGILRELSAVWLIGDVGITPKNFGNWGIRVGTDDVVCLDFAYIFDSSSSLFVCRNCKANSMLIPDKDYKELVCPSCGKKTLFEDIRMKIPDSYHEQQIGDLTKEGYPMTSSNVLTELTVERSNYLAKSEKDDTKSVVSQIIEEASRTNSEEVIKNPIIKEEEKMRKNAVSIDATSAVAGRFEQYKGIVINATTDETEKETTQEAVPETVGKGGIIFTSDVKSFDAVSTTPEEAKGASEPVSGVGVFHNSFIENSNRAVSIISNRIVDYLKNLEAFDVVREYLKGKNAYSDKFYPAIQNSIFHTLVEFMQFEQKEVPNSDGNGTHRIYQAVPEIVNDPTYPAGETLRFIERVFNTRKLNAIKDNDDMLGEYMTMYGIEGLMQCEWLDMLEANIQNRIGIDADGAEIISTFIGNSWCVDREDDTEDDPSEDTDQEDALPNINGSYEIKGSDDEGEVEDPELSQIIAEINGEQEGEENGEDEYDDYMEQSTYLAVTIWPEGDFDVVKIDGGDAFGPISIPIYTNLDEASGKPICVADERNGYWDWLAAMVPDTMFKTKDPEKYLRVSNAQECDEEQIRIVILDQDNEGYYIMGCYMVGGIYIVDGEDADANFNEDLLIRVNNVINEAVGKTQISHRKRSVSIKDLIHTEDYIQGHMNIDEAFVEDDGNGTDAEPDVPQDEPNESDGESPEPEEEGSESFTTSAEIAPESAAEAAAMAALMSDDPAPVAQSPVNNGDSYDYEDHESRPAKKKGSTKRDSKGRFIKDDDDEPLEPVTRKSRKK